MILLLLYSCFPLERRLQQTLGVLKRPLFGLAIFATALLLQPTDTLHLANLQGFPSLQSTTTTKLPNITSSLINSIDNTQT